MEHYLNVCDIDGGKIQPVDIVTFGSPCQDLSIAGKRAGIKHEDSGDEETTRSGLFMEAVRIIKEMREKTDGVYPTFAFWENVPGAFSSNKGEDFRTVLEEIARIRDKTAVIPRPPKGKWSTSGTIMGDGWSVAWRVFDAQFWGVPQRRRRIALVADFTGERAPEILFERESMSRDSEAGGTQRKETPADAERSPGADDFKRCIAYSFDSLASNSMKSSNPSGTLATNNDQYLFQPTTSTDTTTNAHSCAILKQFLFENHSQDARYKGPLSVCPMLSAQLGTGGNNQPLVACVYPDIAYTLSARHDGSPQPDKGNGANIVICIQGNCIDRADTAGCNGKGWREDVCYTLNTIDRPAVVFAMQAFSDYKESEKSSTLKSRDYKDVTDIVCEYAGIDCRNMNETPELYPTLQAKPNGGQSLNFSHAVRIKYIVRRLTPTECARLQGFPDCWGHIDYKDDFTDEEYRFWLDVRNTHASINGKTVREYTKAQMLTWYNKLHTDSAEYKMWGNGVALPFVRYPISKMAALGAKTLGSLFDGSGGFPLAGVLEGITPLWASEIEPYPIAVTTSRFKGGGESHDT